MLPPPTTGYNRDDYNRNRGPRGYDDSGYSRPQRNEYGGYAGGRRDDYGDRRLDDYGRRDGGPRRERGDDGARGNWNRGSRIEDEDFGGGSSSADNWRRDAPPPTSDRSGDFDRRPRDNGRSYRDDLSSRDHYSGSRGGGDLYGRRGQSEDDGGYGGPPSRIDGFRRPPARGDDLYEPTSTQRGERGPSGSDDEPPRSFAPPQLRDRAMSGRSERSTDDHQDGVAPALKEDSPRLVRTEVIPDILKDTDDSKPSSYSSIFGGAKPVDTSKYENDVWNKQIEEKNLEAALKEEGAQKAATEGASTTVSESGEAVGEASAAEVISSPAESTSEPRTQRLRPGVDGQRLRNGDSGHRSGGVGQRRFDDRNNDRTRHRDGLGRAVGRRRDGGFHGNSIGGPGVGGSRRGREGGDYDRGYNDPRPMGGQLRYDDGIRGHGQQRDRAYYGRGGGMNYGDYNRGRHLSESDETKV